MIRQERACAWQMGGWKGGLSVPRSEVWRRGPWPLCGPALSPAPPPSPCDITQAMSDRLRNLPRGKQVIAFANSLQGMKSGSCVGFAPLERGFDGLRRP